MSSLIPVEIVPYDPRWPARFSRARRQILSVIGGYITGIEHIGSTAVPGLAAKPVIDILIGVRSLAEAPAFLPPLTGLGYAYIPEHESAFPERRYLHRIVHRRHTHHLHIVEPGCEFYRTHMLFRDYLRAHPDAAAAYGALKSQLAEQYHLDREAYTEGKSDFIREILRRAEIES